MSLLLALTASGGGSSVTGTLAATLDGISVSASGTVGHSGSVSATLGDVSFSASGSVGHSGTIAATLDGVSFDSSGNTSGQQAAGGIGKPKRVYLERDGKILVFANASRAAAYVAAEKEAEKPEQASTIKPQATKKAEVRPIHQPVEIIAYDAIAVLLARFRLQDDLTDLIRRHELHAIMALYAKAKRMRDEDDIELLLMAA